MTERQPSLTVYHPIKGITKAQVDNVRGQLRERGHSNDVIKRTTIRANMMKAHLLFGKEFGNLCEDVGRTVTETEVKELGEHIQQGLSILPVVPRPVRALPARLLPEEDAETGKIIERRLFIGGESSADLLNRRELVKRIVIHDFFGSRSEDISEGVLQDDEEAVGISVGSSTDIPQLSALKDYERIVNTGDTLAPPDSITTIRFEPVKVRYHF